MYKTKTQSEAAAILYCTNRLDIRHIHLAAAANRKLSESANVIDEKIHQSQFVAESDNHIKTAGM